MITINNYNTQYKWTTMLNEQQERTIPGDQAPWTIYNNNLQLTTITMHNAN